MKRPLLLWAGGFVLGEVLTLLGVWPWICVWIVAILFFCGVQIETGRGVSWEPLPVSIWIFIGFLWLGMFRMQQECDVIAEEMNLDWDGKHRIVEGEIFSIEQKSYGTVLVLNGEEVRKIRILVYEEDLQSLKIGNSLQVEGTIELMSLPRNPGEFHSRNYYLSKKIVYQMEVDHYEVVGTETDGYREGLRRISAYVSTILAQIAPEDVGIYKAILLGDQTELDADVKGLYQRNGIAHLLAISGLHVSLLGATLYSVIRRSSGRFDVAGLIGICFLISYTVLTGSSASVIRASIMLILVFLAAYLGRTYDLLTALSIAAIFILWDSPYQILQAGFQLSFGAVLGIGIWQSVVKKLEITNNIQLAFMGSLGIQLATMPIVLYHFFQIPLYGVLLNLLVIPLMSYVVASGVIGVLLGSLWLWGGIFAIGSGHYILLLYEQLCLITEQLPSSNLILGQPEIWQLGLYYFMFFSGIMLFLWEKFNWKVGSIVVLGMVLGVIPIYPKNLEITCLDVGQGDGICIQKGNVTVLIDGGSTDIKELGTYRLEPYLKSQGISTVFASYVTHGDTDHLSGILYLLEEGKDITIEHLMLPIVGQGNEVYDALVSAAMERGTTVHWIGAGHTLEYRGIELECLYPMESDKTEDVNGHSLVLELCYGDLGMLFTGDMGEEQEKKVLERYEKERLSRIQILKVAHHGSSSSTCESWVAAVLPRWGIISSGIDNMYGHPHDVVVDRLESYGVSLWQTSKQGAITLKTNGKTIEWETYLCLEP